MPMEVVFDIDSFNPSWSMTEGPRDEEIVSNKMKKVYGSTYLSYNLWFSVCCMRLLSFCKQFFKRP